jgi:hypothetical protein
LKQDKHLIKGFYLKIIILQLLFLSFAAVFNKLAPLMLVGASLFMIVIPYLLMFFIFFSNFSKISIYDITFLGILLFFAITIIFARTFVYSESFEKIFSGDIYVLFIPFSFLIFKNLFITTIKMCLIRKIIFIILLLNFLNSSLYIFGLNYFETQFEDSDRYIAFSRFSGLFGSPNISSNVVMLLTVIYLLTANKFKAASTILLSVVFFITVLPNVSRGPLLLYTIFIFYYIFFNIKFSFINLVSIIIASLSGIAFFVYLITYSEVGIFFNSSIDRFEELDQKYGRLDRFFLTINLLTDNFFSFLIGVKGSNQTINSDFNISDNSLTLFLANFGLPFTLFFVFLIIRYVSFFNIANNKKIIYTLIIISAGVLNNAVLWTVWSLYVILGYKLLSIKDQEKQGNLIS